MVPNHITDGVFGFIITHMDSRMVLMYQLIISYVAMIQIILYVTLEFDFFLGKSIRSCCRINGRRFGALFLLIPGRINTEEEDWVGVLHC